MNKKNFLLYGISAAAVLLTVAGCKVPTITAEFMMPPKVITDLKGVDTLEIAVDVSLNGNAIAQGDESIAQGVLCERIAAGLGKEKFYRTTDFVWGNPEGANKLNSLIRSKNSKHGYARMATDPVTPRARMEVKIEAQITTGAQDIVVPTKLKTVFYRTMYREQTITWGPRENPRREKIRIPYSVPANQTASVAQSKVRDYWLDAAGRVSVKLFNKKGQVVYEREFPNLKYSTRCNHQNLNALPTNAQVLSLMTRDTIENVVKEISPYKKSNTLKINKDGDKRGFYLLQALALSEAVENFEALKEEKRTFADWENLGVAYEALGDFETAQDCYAQASKVKKEKKGWFDYDKQIAEEGTVRIEKIIAAQQRLEKAKK